MDKRDAEALEHEINAARPQTHRGVVMWAAPSIYVLDCRILRTAQRHVFESRDEYLAARIRELKAGGAAVH